MKDRTKADMDYPVTDLAVAASKDFDEVVIIAETVDHPPGGPPRRSGKTIHLRATRKQAMILLSGLEAMRKALGLPAVPQSSAEFVPTAKERN